MLDNFMSWSEATQCLEGSEGNGHFWFVVGILIDFWSLLMKFLSMTL